ncbi:hypothetical protein T12_8214 [Trichinella patagoniensis]|uniref:Uncharacterized protein n=1 Tax=Trichinella patagoniensis TaxID=990121 RepID=A0A0V0ZMY7_9BILA|nr:hypothetical protein T12_8214 [Trichinella patagoniensis]
MKVSSNPGNQPTTVEYEHADVPTARICTAFTVAVEKACSSIVTPECRLSISSSSGVCQTYDSPMDTIEHVNLQWNTNKRTFPLPISSSDA